MLPSNLSSVYLGPVIKSTKHSLSTYWSGVSFLNKVSYVADL